MTTILKACTKCGHSKPLDDFYKERLGRLGRRSKCKACMDCASGKWMRENKASFSDYARKHYRENRRHSRSVALLRKFGISVEQYDAMLDGQAGACALCLEPETVLDWRGGSRCLSVDHDHDDGRIRGLLCFRCNTAVGRIEKGGLVRLSSYLFDPTLAAIVAASSLVGDCLCAGRRRCTGRLRDFGVSCVQYKAMLSVQSSVCALCGGTDKSKDLAVDHDHATGRIRGLLCLVCNTSLGRFEKDRAIFLRLTSYLWPKTSDSTDSSRPVAP